MTPEQQLYEQTKASKLKAQEAHDRAVQRLTLALQAKPQNVQRTRAARQAIEKTLPALQYWQQALIAAEMRL